MAPKQENTPPQGFSQTESETMLPEQLRWAVRLALESILQAEGDAFIGTLPYERSPARRDRRNGHYTRSLETSVGRVADLAVPLTRRGYRTQLFERYARRREELDAAMSAMFIGGVSTRGAGAVMEHLTGSAPSPSTVSRVFHTLESEYQTWQGRVARGALPVWCLPMGATTRSCMLVRVASCSSWR